jgi:hypothetical protein
MFPHQSEMLARARIADITRASEGRAARRSSLRILLEARRSRRQNPAR